MRARVRVVVDDSGDVMSPEEFAVACRKLSESDWTKIRRGSKSYAFGNVIDSRDLLNEAIRRTLSGERRCPRDIESVAAYLLLTMRSIGSDEQKDWHREHGPRPVRRITKDGDVMTREVEYESDEPDPEEFHIEREQDQVFAERKHQVLMLFANDPVGRTCVDLMIAGYRGADLQKELGFDDVAYATVRRRIKRRLAILTQNQ